MNLLRQLEFLNPNTITETIHIIGLGAIGSNIAMHLTRMGFNKFTLYDFDGVESHNIPNQIYDTEDIGKAKDVSTKAHMLAINPEAQIRTFALGWSGQTLSGYVFMCVDSIATRNKIREHCSRNMYVKALFDFRMGLTSAQHYAANCSNDEEMMFLKASMDFKEEEVKVPVSACGSALTVLPTITTITALGCANFINYIKGRKYRKLIDFDVFDMGYIGM